jgi:hypothetical protein
VRVSIPFHSGRTSPRPEAHLARSHFLRGTERWPWGWLGYQGYAICRYREFTDEEMEDVLDGHLAGAHMPACKKTE